MEYYRELLDILKNRVNGGTGWKHQEGSRMKMKNMLDTLRKAKLKKVFTSQQEFRDVLTQIRLADAELKLDWDDGAGEEWAKFSNLSDGITIRSTIIDVLHP